MNDVAAGMMLLQFGDSFFPSGSVSFSWGLEELVANGVVMDAETVQAFVVGQLHARWAQFDRAVVVLAHRSMENLEAVAAVDDQVEIQTPCAELRSGSRRMGEGMLAVFARLGIGDVVPTYRNLIKRGLAYGHVAPMQGLLWGRAGLSERDVIALSAHTFCTALLGAGLRLGCLTHIDAQRAMLETRHEASWLAELPLPAINELSTYGLQAEIAVMRHGDSSARVFAN